MDLAAQNALKTIIGDMITFAPEWAYDDFPLAHLEARDGGRDISSVSHSCTVASAPGLCLDREEVREAAGRFLRELAKRYRWTERMGGKTGSEEIIPWLVSQFVVS